MNRKGGSVYGIPCSKQLQDVPGPVDLVILAIPQEAIEQTVDQCASLGVKGITVITAGFSETGEEGRAREKALVELCRRHGILVLGPNVSGTFYLHARFNASGSPASYLVPSGLAALCQGGYAFYDLLAAGGSMKMVVGWVVHTGNESDLTVTDFLELLGEEEAVRGILMYLETIRDPRRFLAQAKKVSQSKPIVVFKAGNTASGARGAKSHTGALARGPKVYLGAFKQAGILLSPSLELLLPLGGEPDR